MEFIEGLLATLDIPNIKPTNLIRLGRKEIGKTRPLKVCLKDTPDKAAFLSNIRIKLPLFSTVHKRKVINFDTCAWDEVREMEMEIGVLRHTNTK